MCTWSNCIHDVWHLRGVLVVGIDMMNEWQIRAAVCWSLNTFCRQWHFVMCANCFHMYFFEVGDLKISCHEVWKVWTWGWHLYFRWRSRKCGVLIVFYMEGWNEEGATLGSEKKLCHCFSCVWGLRSLLNTEGILTLQVFLLSDGSLIEMLSASFSLQCRVLLSLSIVVKSVSPAFGCFVEIWWFLMALVVWFLRSETVSFRDLLVSPMSSAVHLLVGHFQW